MKMKDDFISRQDAIEAILKEANADGAYGYIGGEEAEKVLNALPTVKAVEIKKEGELEMFDLISSAYYGKGMYFKQDNGMVYSRYSCKYMSVDEAIREFVSLIDGSDFPDVVERKKGKWVYYPKVSGSVKSTAVHLYPVCSECGCEHPIANYCPNCGAVMDESEEPTMEEYMYGQEGSEEDGSL